MSEKDRLAPGPDQDDLRRLRSERRRRVEAMLHADITRQAPGNAIYWLAMIGGAFLLNLAVLVAVAR
jgi:hypothetical protein